ncbi:MAG: ABC transporter substrate-binding protein [Aquabacterium sp.]|nr:ABC transporter substrate-binding protein [Aquabacterium sp.]
MKKLATALTTVLVLAGAAQAQPKPAAAAAEKPQYGGALSVANVYYTISPLTFDSIDWAWKFNQDTGLVYEQLFVADLSKAKRNGGKYPFVSDSFLPPDSLRGELAEKWELKQNPWRLEVQLRKGIMWPAKPGVMAARELTSDDVVYSFERVNKSAKKIPTYFDHVSRIEVTGKHAFTMHFSTYNAEWDYRWGWGYYSAIVPKEVMEGPGSKDWKNVTGTGPYALTNYVQGNQMTFTKNAAYWDSETIGGEKYKLPFADTITYRYIKDESTALTALRTGKIDIMESVRWSAVDELKKSAPKLQWNKFISNNGSYITLRTDQKPFDDPRVRRALNLAVNKPEIIKTYYGGNAEMLGFPMHSSWVGYYEALADMPESVRELYVYNPAKAKALLAEAGYPNGFSFKAQTSSASLDNDLLAMVAAYLAKVGVKMEIQVMEYSAYLSAMTTKTNAAGYFLQAGLNNPTTSLRKTFVSKQTWNPSQHSDPEFDKKMAEVYAEPDERVRQIKVKLMVREILDKAPHIFLPAPVVYSAWWPWVKNYGGELRAGADRPGPIHARVWVDQAMKKQMGY